MDEVLKVKIEEINVKLNNIDDNIREIRNDNKNMNDRIVVLEERHRLCYINDAKEVIRDIPSILMELKQLREEQEFIINEIKELRTETEVVRFLYKYPKVFWLIVLSLTGGGIANIINLFF